MKENGQDIAFWELFPEETDSPKTCGCQRMFGSTEEATLRMS